jgi:hypothetical protein
VNCSQQNFVQSQHFYGLCISKGADLPPLDAPVGDWLAALDKLNALAKISAANQIKSNKGED